MRRYFRAFPAVCLILSLMLAAGGSAAEELLAEDRGVDLTETVSVHYPAVTGTADGELSERINNRILEDLRIMKYLERATALISGGELKVGWTGGILGDVFSGAAWAEGEVENPRGTFVWTSANIDLRDGHEITFEELFTDADAARELAERFMEDVIAPEMSAHLLNSELLPLPDRFRLDSAGLILLYPADRLSTLSDRAGDIRIGWNALRSALDLGEDSIPTRMGVGEMITLTPQSGEKLKAAAAEGTLPGIPARIGDSMQELTDRYRMLTDPDGYENGRMFALEDAAFGGVFLLTDDLSRDWKNSRVEGIRIDRGCAWGLCVGETQRDDWLAALGEPENTAEIGGEKAEANRLVPGRCDYYRCGSYQLRLYSDAEGILVSVALAE